MSFQRLDKYMDLSVESSLGTLTPKSKMRE